MVLPRVLDDHGVAHRVAGLVVTLVLTALSYRFVELPFLRRKRRLAVAELEVPETARVVAERS